MQDVTLIEAQKAYTGVESGQALLVCAYDDDEKFRKFHLSGAIPLSEFKSGLDKQDRDREIIFYCA